MSKLNNEDKEILLDFVKLNISFFLEDLTMKLKQGHIMTNTEKIILGDYIKIIALIDSIETEREKIYE